MKILRFVYIFVVCCISHAREITIEISGARTSHVMDKIICELHGIKYTLNYGINNSNPAAGIVIDLEYSDEHLPKCLQNICAIIDKNKEVIDNLRVSFVHLTDDDMALLKEFRGAIADIIFSDKRTTYQKVLDAALYSIQKAASLTHNVLLCIWLYSNISPLWHTISSFFQNTDSASTAIVEYFTTQ